MKNDLQASVFICLTARHLENKTEGCREKRPLKSTFTVR